MVEFDDATPPAGRSVPGGEATGPTRRIRRRQVDRSAETRERIIASAFELLHTLGYAGASTMAIAKHAGLSQGALQHQFQTKALLMTAVLRRSIAIRFVVYRRALRHVRGGRARFQALSEASWQLIGTREISASIEIEQAMRNDPDLALAAAPTFARHSAFVRRLVGRMLGDEVAAAPAEIETIRLLNNAILTGMSLELGRSSDPTAVARAIDRWRRVLFDDLLRDPSA